MSATMDVAMDDNLSAGGGSELSSHENSVESADELNENKPKKSGQARACGECNRRKIKCDKRSPRCSLCARTGQDCYYPKKRRRTTRPWELSAYPRRVLETEGEEGLNRILDQLDSAMLEKALLRRGERQSSLSNTNSQSPQVPPPPDFSPSHVARIPTDGIETDVCRGNNMNLGPFAEHTETRFFADVFDDPALGSWLTDSFTNAQGAEALQGNTGAAQDFLLSRTQDATGILEPNYNFQFGFFPAFGTSSMAQGNAKPNRYSMPVPAAVVDETIDAFFKDVACWLPLFHRPRFYTKYNVYSQDPEKYQSLALEDCLILDSICALAARFSTSSYFAHLSAKGRAEPFLSQATQLFQDALKLDAAIQANISLLQGLTLLGWYHQVCGSSGRCGNLIGISCRLAYDLGLNNIDQEILESKTTVQWASPEEWSKKEELRRAWWLAWELDMFSGTILKRPHTIDKTHINVLLPVSDEAWFSDTPIPSVAVIPDPLLAWKTLKDSPNNDDRAWFLVASFLRALAHDIIHRRHTTAQTIADFQSSITCFSLIAPQRFQLSASCLSFDDSNYAANNWIICTHLILHSSRASLRLLCHRKFPEQLDVTLETSALEDERLLCRLIREWDPNYIARTCPLVSTTLLGPGAINAKTACELAADPGESRPMYLEMLKLVLGVIGSYWQIGASVLELVQLLEARRSITELVNPRKNDLDRLPLLLPRNDDEDPGS